MASTYPTALDAFTNPTGTSLLTSPDHAQQHSDLNDAVEALEAKVAIGATVLGTYTAYTPTIVGLTVGNGTLSSSYCQVNNFVHYFGRIVIGSTSVFTGGSFSITVPLNLDATFTSATSSQLGNMAFRDISTGSTFMGTGRTGASNATIFFVEVNSVGATYATGTNITGSIPMTWATGDILSWNFYYKAA